MPVTSQQHQQVAELSDKNVFLRRKVDSNVLMKSETDANITVH